MSLMFCSMKHGRNIHMDTKLSTCVHPLNRQFLLKHHPLTTDLKLQLDKAPTMHK